MSIDMMDSNPPQPERVMQDSLKIEALRSSLPSVTKKIGRLIRPTEAKSLGYVLDKGWNDADPISSKSFVGDVLGLKEGVVGHAAEKIIYDRVYETLETDFNTRLAASEGNTSEAEKLKSLWAMIKDGQAYANEAFKKGDVEIHLGGVPGHWLPSWVRSFDQ